MMKSTKRKLPSKAKPTRLNGAARYIAETLCGLPREVQELAADMVDEFAARCPPEWDEVLHGKQSEERGEVARRIAEEWVATIGGGEAACKKVNDIMAGADREDQAAILRMVQRYLELRPGPDAMDKAGARKKESPALDRIMRAVQSMKERTQEEVADMLEQCARRLRFRFAAGFAEDGEPGA